MARRTPAALALLLLSCAAAVAQPVAVTKLFGSTTDRFDRFGSATDMDGNFLLVGAWGENDSPPMSRPGGRIFAFRYTGAGSLAGWEEDARLYPTPEFPHTTQLGEAVALLRGSMRVPGLALGVTFAIGGAPNETVGKPLPHNFSHGAAYVYRRDTTGAWTLDGRLVPEAVESEDNTGSAVALTADAEGGVWAAAWSDRYLVVWRRDGPSDAPGVWTEEQRLNVGGYALGFGETYFAGSAPAEGRSAARLSGPTGDGFVRVWRRDGGQTPPWVEEAALVPSADGPGDAFGASVALDGDLLVVGSYHAVSGLPPGGRAYVFRYTGDGPFGGWEEEAVLEPAVPRSNFGRFVSAEAVAGGADAVVVHSGVPAFGTVAAHLFRRDPATGAWGEAPPVEGSELGFTGWVRGTAGGFAVTGDEFDEERGDRAGAAYLVDLRGLVVTAEPGPAAPGGLALSAHPNPARGAAALSLVVPEAGGVRVGLYDGLGRRVALIHEGVLGAGAHRLALDVGGLAPGVYLARAEAAGGVATARLAVVR